MIRLERVCVRAGGFELTDIELALEQGDYAVLLGRTGCGKTTLLECLCGLKPLTSGRILLDGRDISDARPGERGIGYVPQEGVLFRTMSVRENLSFALEVQRWSAGEMDARVAELADLLSLRPLLDRGVHGLSGGERQRVALGRALAARPSVLCLDEPLSALDHQTREEMIAVLESVREQTGVTAFHVTHNLAEASRLATRTFVIEGGTLSAIAGESPG
ncbi:MAG: ABC transporter ATP-binding protein [Planctomycetes bacterium]|nr:ABC transporter ATP-binding protein [Planctomycetota bacterium]MDP6409915.1 ABC transporter ATP-binding protein [Planctomycetota bacterium]